MFKLILTGDIINFIAPRMMPFIYFATITFFVLGVIQIWRSGSKKEDEVHCGCGIDHDHVKGSPIRSVLLYSVFIIPIVTGFTFADNVLDSSVIETRGIKYGSGLYTKPPSPEEAAALKERDLSRAEAYLENPDEYMNDLEAAYGEEEIPLEHPEGFEVQEVPQEYYDELKEELLKQDTIIVSEDKYIPIMNIIDSNVDQFVGKELEIVGFVYRELDFTKDQIVIARFGLSCCVADASIYGTLSTGDLVKELENDQWIRAKGTITTTEYNDWILPYLQISELEIIEQPKEPYIYEYY